MLVQPAQFWILTEVLDQSGIVTIVVIGQYPSDVGPPETALPGRVYIALPVGMLMMNAMVRRPPQDALLPGRFREKGHR